jgi:hypothetical protein
VLTAKDLSSGDPEVHTTQSDAVVIKDSEWGPELFDRVSMLLKNAIRR